MGLWGVDMAGCLATGAGGCRTGDWLADRTGLEVPEAVILVFIARGGIPDLPPRVRLRKFQALKTVSMGMSITL